MESLNKILKVIKKKDDYGVFLVPVDTNIVTDYALIIKNPMDFGTMQKKIDTKKYKSISEFQNDFELVIKNAKIYNAPETIYYRSAEKISK
ncbi:Bromodomain-containing protein, partial [Neocallimastix californiae]